MVPSFVVRLLRSVLGHDPHALIDIFGAPAGPVSRELCDTSRQPARYRANRAILWPAGALISTLFGQFVRLVRLGWLDFLPLSTGL